MNKGKRIASLLLVLAMTVGMLASCASGQNAASSAPASSAASSSAAPAEDTITMLLPPVSATYQDQLTKWGADFKAQNPNLTLKAETASWEDYLDKMDVQINAGSPPDVAFVEFANVSKYVDSGLIVDLNGIVSAEQLADFDKTPLDYYKSGEGVYGLPVYVSLQCLGGNKEFLEAAGIDWKKIQQSGWTYEEFREAIKKGTITENGKTRYGFTFACSGVTAVDYLSILSKNAGMPAAFNKDLKYAYTSKNFLKLLESIREMIDDGSMPKELSSVDGGKRWNMFLTGQTMIFGKGLANFESLALANNKKIDAKDGSAVEGSIKTEYVVLPVPTFWGNPQQAQGAVGGYGVFRGKTEPTAEHLANAAKAAYFMSSGDVAAFTANELFLSAVSNSARASLANIKNEVPRSAENAAAMATLTAQIAEARPDIPAELGAKAQRLQDEVVVPKMQALLANEITAQQMYDAVKAAAIDTFGEDGIVKD